LGIRGTEAGGDGLKVKIENFRDMTSRVKYTLIFITIKNLTEFKTVTDIMVQDMHKYMYIF
jgi:hypothetical protein